jgi:hexosaminidase
LIQPGAPGPRWIAARRNEVFMRVLLMSFLLVPLLSGAVASCLAAPAPTLNLMPVPSRVQPAEGRLRLARDFSVGFATPADPRSRLAQGATRFLRRLDARTQTFFTNTTPGAVTAQQSTLLIDVGKVGALRAGEDESYALTVSGTQIRLRAATDLGALHGLETLLQLLDSDAQGYYFPQVAIDDAPRFVWRGLMLDVARHFMPLNVVTRNIDAMAAVKLNVLHLHLTDNQGFRIESKRYPKLQQTANGEYFSQNDIRTIVAYAALRGIRVVPEFDVPTHATSWLSAYPELGSRPGASYTPWTAFGVADPVLNPTLDATYRFLDQFFTEILPLFPDQYVHIGGDENRDGADWRDNPAIQAFMKTHHIANNHELQAYFNQRIIKSTDRLNKKIIGWEEILHPSLPSSAVVHIWLDKESLFKTVKLGYSAIMSKGFYIDLMHPVAEHYLSDPVLPEGANLPAAELARILGGEATMWSEMANAANVDTRIWPVTAAVAERLWSPAAVRDLPDMYRRLDITSGRLEELGLTHLSAPQAIMRNLAGGSAQADVTPLVVLLDVVAPLKGRGRNQNHDVYFTTSPLSGFADAAIRDPRGARLFGEAMTRYLAGDTAEAATLRRMLEGWIANDARLVDLARSAPGVRATLPLSARLKALAEVALALLEPGRPLTPQQDQQAMAALVDARQPGAGTELQVADAVEALLAWRRQP